MKTLSQKTEETWFSLILFFCINAKLNPKSKNIFAKLVNIVTIAINPKSDGSNNLTSTIPIK